MWCITKRSCFLTLVSHSVQVIVEDTSQPTLDNLHEALGKAYGIPASRVWAIKHNWGKREWARLTREMGVKKVWYTVHSMYARRAVLAIFFSLFRLSFFARRFFYPSCLQAGPLAVAVVVAAAAAGDLVYYLSLRRWWWATDGLFCAPVKHGGFMSIDGKAHKRVEKGRCEDALVFMVFSDVCHTVVQDGVRILAGRTSQSLLCRSVLLQGNKKSKKSRRLVTNLRETPYSLKDGDVVAAVDRLEDESGVADLTRADDEVSALGLVSAHAIVALWFATHDRAI